MKAARACLPATRLCVNVGSHAAMPDIPGLRDAHALTHIEALELDDVPTHLIVLGGGYTGIEMAQAYRRFGSRVTIIEPGPQIMAREDADIAEEMQQNTERRRHRILLNAHPIRVDGLNGESVIGNGPDDIRRTEDRRQPSAGGGRPDREYGEYWSR